MFKTTVDLTGQTFGTITVDEFLGYRTLSDEGQRRFSYFKCHCSCGNEFELSGRAIERFTDPILDHTCSCPQIPYCSLTAIPLRHLRLRYDSFTSPSFSFPVFCYLSLSACSICGTAPKYPTLNHVRKTRNSLNYMSICTECKQDLMKSRV